MSDYDWSRFAVRININAPMDKLYRAWATRSGMESWFLRLSEYRRPGGAAREMDEPVDQGDAYSWLWHGYPDETVEYGNVLDCNGRDLFKFSFGKAGNCTVKIYSENEERIVELIQESIPTDEQGRHNWHLGCKTGWTFYLANLKSICEGGLDLRNKNVALQQVVNA